MLAYTYVSPGRFELMEKPRPTLQDSRDAIVRVTLASICSSDLHIRVEACRGLCPASPSDTKWWVWWRKPAPALPA